MVKNKRLIYYEFVLAVMEQTIDTLFGIEEDELIARLDSEGNYNKTVGINILRLEELSSDELEVYMASIDPGRFVKPHVHMGQTAAPNFDQELSDEPAETELYHFLKGRGIMYKAPILFDSRGNPAGHGRVDHPIVAPRTVVTVSDGEIHMAVNTENEEKLYFMFTCPPEHMKDPPVPGADRFILETYAPEIHDKWMRSYAPLRN